MMRTLTLAAFLVVALTTPAIAMPAIFIPVFVGIGFSTFFATVAAYALTTVLTMALSYVAQSLLKPAAQSSQSSLTSGATGSGGSVSVDQKQTVRQALAARKVIYGRTRVGGVYLFLNVADKNQFLYYVIAFVGHECDAFEEIWFDEVSVDFSGAIVAGGRYAGNARVDIHLGGADQVADASMVAWNPGMWTTAHRARGIAYISGYLIWDNQAVDGSLGAKIWSGGIPNITAVLRGKKVFDPRTGLTVYSNNSALCVADYLTDTTYGRGVDYATRINDEALIAAANACDELVTRPDGSTEKRYTTDGVFQSDADPDEILGRLLGAMHGKAIYDGERWTIYAGVYQTPTLTITDDHMRRPSQIATLTSARDSANAIKGTYVGPENGWQPADFPPIISAAMAAVDGGDVSYKDIELPFTVSPGRAQRLAKIDLLRGRQEISEQFYGKLSCWPVKVGATIYRTSARYGFALKPFEVAAKTLVVDRDDQGTPVLCVDLTLLEIAPEVYDWNTSEESVVDPAPNTNFPDVFGVLPPSNLRAIESLYSSRDGGGVKAKLTLKWDRSEDKFVQQGGLYRPRYRRLGDTAWTALPDTTTLFAEILDISAGTYQIQVFAVNWAGNSSLPVSLTIDVVGLSAPPARPTNFTVASKDTVAYARWDLSPDLDVTEGGFIVIKHSALESGATWDTALSLGEDIPGNANSVVLPLVSGTYLAKFRDASGLYSPTAASFVQFQHSVHTFAGLTGGSSIQDPEFAGVKTNCAVEGGVLRMAAGGDFDSVPDVDALPSWDWYGGVISTASYAYDAPMILTGVKKCRLTNTVEAGIENIFDDFDSRLTDSDSWASWDGDASGDEADSWLMVRSTEDNPAGSPIWSEWQRLHSSTFDAWGFEFRRDFISLDPSFGVAIFADSVVAEGV